MPISSSRDRLTAGQARPSTGDIDAPKQADSKGKLHETQSSSDAVKPRKVTLPHTEKPRKEKDSKNKVKTSATRNAIGVSLSHGSALNKDKPLMSSHQSKSHHHQTGHQRANHHHKKRKPKKEKEGDDITLRKIRYFSSRPKSAPLTLCLSYPGVQLSHRELLDAITSGSIHKHDIQSIQFVDMNCILGTAGVDNRWLVKVKDLDTRYLLLRECIWLNDDALHFRLLDDVNVEDYREYQRRMDTLRSDEHISAVERLLALHGQI